MISPTTMISPTARRSRRRLCGCARRARMSGRRLGGVRLRAAASASLPSCPSCALRPRFSFCVLPFRRHLFGVGPC
eukprot:7168740-Prymnesium_polylepis.1